MLSSATASWASQERARLLLQLEALERLPRSPTAAPGPPVLPPPPPLPSAASLLVCDPRPNRKATAPPAHAPPAPTSAVAAVHAGASAASLPKEDAVDGNETEDSAFDA